ncbi:hypothetical protein ETSB_0580 [cyanobacterium endosymbiont of Epithemia turgida isolate EtSB Lake Yunoko]|nr:hypothetical protein ETSB_0580 [cyanobacterium endosymbiont of Epithemia turgida isolate EtSB Lake Yunoko]
MQVFVGIASLPLAVRQSYSKITLAKKEFLKSYLFDGED